VLERFYTSLLELRGRVEFHTRYGFHENSVMRVAGQLKRLGTCADVSCFLPHQKLIFLGEKASILIKKVTLECIFNAESSKFAGLRPDPRAPGPRAPFRAATPAYACAVRATR